MTSSNCRSSRSGRGSISPRFEPRLEIEIVGDRAVLEIEIDQAGRGLAARAAAVEQQHRGLDRQRGDADAAGRRQERVDLRLGRRRCRPARLRRRAQARTRSTGGTGLTRKSATRICTSVRATLASKACDHGDHRRPARRRAPSAAAARRSRRRCAASRSTMTTVASVEIELVGTARASVPATTSSSIARRGAERRAHRRARIRRRRSATAIGCARAGRSARCACLLRARDLRDGRADRRRVAGAGAGLPCWSAVDRRRCRCRAAAITWSVR